MWFAVSILVSDKLKMRHTELAAARVRLCSTAQTPLMELTLLPHRPIDHLAGFGEGALRR